MLNFGEGIAIGTISVGLSSVLITMIKTRSNGRYVEKVEYNECVKRLEQSISSVDSKIVGVDKKVDILLSRTN